MAMWTTGTMARGTMTEGIDETLGNLARILETSEARAVQAARAAEAIRTARGYRWMGIYDVLPDEIAVIAWSGPEAPAFPRFPRTKGLNGAAVASGEPVVAQDVANDSRYLTALGTTRAEAIVPVADPDSGRIMGTLDVESARVNAFTDDDLTFLDRCAAALLPLWKARE